MVAVTKQPPVGAIHVAPDGEASCRERPVPTGNVGKGVRDGEGVRDTIRLGVAEGDAPRLKDDVPVGVGVCVELQEYKPLAPVTTILPPPGATAEVAPEPASPVPTETPTATTPVNDPPPERDET